MLLSTRRSSPTWVPGLRFDRLDRRRVLVYPGPDGTIARRRFAPSGHASERRWQCRGCATAVDDADALSARLSRIQATHFE